MYAGPVSQGWTPKRSQRSWRKDPLHGRRGGETQPSQEHGQHGSRVGRGAGRGQGWGTLRVGLSRELFGVNGRSWAEECKDMIRVFTRMSWMLWEGQMPVTRVRVGLGAVGTAEQGRWPVPGETMTKVRQCIWGWSYEDFLTRLVWDVWGSGGREKRLRVDTSVLLEKLEQCGSTN